MKRHMRVVAAYPLEFISVFYALKEVLLYGAENRLGKSDRPPSQIAGPARVRDHCTAREYGQGGDTTWGLAIGRVGSDRRARARGRRAAARSQPARCRGDDLRSRVAYAEPSRLRRIEARHQGYRVPG